MSLTFKIYNYIEDKYCDEVVVIKAVGIKYVEDLVFTICSKLGITPICAHLFSLFNNEHKLWLCQNQEILTIQSEYDLKELKFNLRIRYLPFSSKDLNTCDPKAFDYYFHQMRNDFLNFPKKKFDEKELEIVLGIAVQDVYRHELENKLTTEEKNRIGTKIYNYCPKMMNKPLFFDVKKKMKDIFNGSNYRTFRVSFVKCCYIDQYLKNIAMHHYDESYNVKYFRLRDKGEFQDKIITYQVSTQQISIRSSESDNWELLFKMSELMFISVKSSSASLKGSFQNQIEISLLNASPIYITFSDELQLKSFVSLLSGYYRLCEKWNFNICEKFFSPYLYKLKLIRCHGPISLEFARQKIRKQQEENEKFCPFIFQQDISNFRNFILYFEKDFKDFSCTIEADIFSENPVFYFEGRQFQSHYDFFEYIRKSKNLSNIVIPSEIDYCPNLLLCRDESTRDKIVTKNDLPVILNSFIKKSTFVRWKNDLCMMKLGLIVNENNDKVMIKEFTDNVDSKILSQISDWIHLKHHAIINCKGIIISPLSVLFERCQTSLREFFQLHKPDISNMNLLQSVLLLGNAMEYLHSKNCVHGYIRFDNLYVSKVTKNKLYIKLGDFIGCNRNFNLDQEKPWLPGEFFDPISVHFHKLTTYSDVWAYGTTVWEIFSSGTQPTFYFETLDSVDKTLIPDSIWNLLIQCWKEDCNQRIQSLSIRRIIFGIISGYTGPTLIENENRNHFTKIENSSGLTSQYYNSSSKKYSKFSFKSRSSTSINSNETDTTSLNQMEDVLSICTSEINNCNSLYEIERIDSDKIRIEGKIGSGTYGVVYRAYLTNLQMLVALKEISRDLKDSSLNEEIEIMAKLKHKNIVQIIGYTLIDNRKALIMEYVELGSLDRYCQKKFEKGQMDIQFLKFALDIAEGLDFLANKNIIHRDLAARNILVKSPSEVKISDFGLSHILQEDIYQVKSSRPLPFRFYAPESLEPKNLFQPKSDVWSFAVVLWEMYSHCRKQPYEALPDNPSYLVDYLRNGNRLEQPEFCPDEVYGIMLNCWDYDPELRPDAKMLVQMFRDLQLS